MPSARVEASIPLTDQFPAPSTVASAGPTEPCDSSVSVTWTVAPGSVVPDALTLCSLKVAISESHAVMAIAGATVSLVAVCEADEEFSKSSVAVAVYVIVPSASEETSMPETDQLPLSSTVAAVGPTEPSPESVIVTSTLAPGSVVPDAPTSVTFDEFTGSVTLVIPIAGSAACLVASAVAVPLPESFDAVAVYVIVPSASDERSIPLTDQSRTRRPSRRTGRRSRRSRP